MFSEEYQLVTVDESRLPEYRAVDEFGFAEHLDPETVALVPFPLPFDRTRAVEHDGELVAVHGSFPYRMSLPGGSVRCAGLTWVAVRPDHRRRGLLTAMINDHLTRSIDRGEAISALFAAEPAIYGRFGYGSAADTVRLTVPRRAQLREVPGSQDLSVRFETASWDTHGSQLIDLQAAVDADRPGWVNRPTEGLRRAMLSDPPAWRGGAEPLRAVTVRRGTDLVGYALLARANKWDEADNPLYTARVRSHGALDPAAAHRLWSFLLDLDLVSAVTVSCSPDDILLQLLVDRRKTKPMLVDNVWVRVIDLPAALSARRYSAPVDVVLGVRDDLLPANDGSWRLTAQPDGTAAVQRTRDQPQLLLDIRDLGALLLGGRSLAALVRAGLVHAADPAAVATTSAAFSWGIAPNTPQSF